MSAVHSAQTKWSHFTHSFDNFNSEDANKYKSVLVEAMAWCQVWHQAITSTNADQPNL